MFIAIAYLRHDKLNPLPSKPCQQGRGLLWQRVLLYEAANPVLDAWISPASVVPPLRAGACRFRSSLATLV